MSIKTILLEVENQSCPLPMVKVQQRTWQFAVFIFLPQEATSESSQGEQRSFPWFTSPLVSSNTPSSLPPLAFSHTIHSFNFSFWHWGNSKFCPKFFPTRKSTHPQVFLVPWVAWNISQQAVNAQQGFQNSQAKEATGQWTTEHKMAVLTEATASGPEHYCSFWSLTIDQWS